MVHLPPHPAISTRQPWAQKAIHKTQYPPIKTDIYTPAQKITNHQEGIKPKKKSNTVEFG